MAVNIWKFLLLIAISQSVPAEIYKWTDASGNVHYGDRRSVPVSSEAKKIQAEINSYTSVSYENVPKTSNKMTMYSTSWCGYCKKARNYFSLNGIPYTEYDIEKNQRARKEYRKMGATGVPVIVY